MGRIVMVVLLWGCVCWAEETKRDQKVIVALTTAEVKALEKAAKEAHLDVPDFIRSRIFEGIEMGTETDAEKSDEEHPTREKESSGTKDSPVKEQTDGTMEIPGWKILMQKPWKKSGNIFSTVADDGMIRSNDPCTKRFKRQFALRVNQITEEPHFRAGLYVGQTTEDWTTGKRIEVCVTSKEVWIVIMDYTPGARRMTTVSKAPFACKKGQFISVKVEAETGAGKTDLMAQFGGAKLSGTVPYDIDGTGWGFIVNRAYVDIKLP